MIQFTIITMLYRSLTGKIKKALVEK